MDPSKVDVNVHPAKLEVRFEEENKVFKAVYHAIRDTLLKAELIASTEKSEMDKNDIDFKEFDSVSPSKPNFIDLFRKIKKEEPGKDNILEDVFQKKQENLENTEDINALNNVNSIEQDKDLEINVNKSNKKNIINE